MIVFRLVKWIAQRVGAHNLLALILLMIGLSSLIWTIADLVRGLSLALLAPLALAGVLLGWILAACRPVPGWLAGLIIAILGVEAIVIRIGRLDGILLALGQDGLQLAWALSRLPLDGLPDLTSPGINLLDLWNSLGALLARLLAWLATLGGEQPVYDPVAASLVWSVSLWLICGWAGWAIYRLAQPLAALAPAGVLLSTILAYRPSQSVNLLPLLTVSLLLLGLTGHAARERRWQRNGVDFALDIRTDLAFAIIPITIFLVVVAGLAPSISISRLARLIQQPFRSQTEQAEPIADSLGLDPADWEERAVPLQELRAPGLPRDHLLGSGPELSQQVALRINTGQAPVPYEVYEGTAPRYYWRSLTYDRYSGRGWSTSATTRDSYEAGQQVSTTDSTLWRVMRQQVVNVRDQGGRMHLAGDLVTADHDFNIDWREPGDIFAITIEAGEEYQLDALVPVRPFTEAELRSAGSEYPDWVAEDYLSLPEDIPERVLALGLDLTATEPTPYDRAKAIESYLREFPYNLDLPAPPSNRDVVDYFLFELQEGYCDYYASSMVVLARAAGLPSRLVVGYASGGYDPASANYIVTEADAHSWVEIFFPTYGWVEFEPTAAQPAVDRTEENAPADYTAGPLPPLTPAGPDGVDWGSLWWLLLPGSLVLALAGLAIWVAADSWRLRRLAPAAAVALLYGRLRRHGRWLATPTLRGETPYEFIRSLIARIEDLARGKRWGFILSPTAQELRWLTDLYVRTSYSSHPPDTADQTQAIKIWRRLRQRLWLAWISAVSARFRK